jgi:hypothetical protein
MKESYYLIAAEGTHTNPAAKAFKEWLTREMTAFQEKGDRT